MDRGGLPQRKPKQQTKQPMQMSRADFQLEKVRQAKEQIDEKTREYQDEYKKVQAEIQQYKEALFEQQKALKQQQNQAEMQKELEQEKRATELQIALSQKQFREFNISKLVITLNSIISRKVRQSKTQAFDAIQLYSESLKFTIDKSLKQRLFRRKAQVFRFWRLEIEQSKRDREFEQIEIKERLLMQISERAKSKLAERIKLKTWKAL